jgi:hypothetical protein
VLLPGAGLSTLATDALLRLIYREDRRFRESAALVRFPSELNRPPESIAAHGRGVSVIGGAAEHVEHGVVLTAIELVACASRLRSLRREASEELATVEGFRDGAPKGKELAPARQELADVTKKIQDLELSISFGIEQYLDSLRVPEIVLTAYRQSLAASLELREGTTATALMIERLRRVVEARALELQTHQATLDERRGFAAALAVGYVTLIAVPIGMIFAFLGASISQVKPSRSLWDVADYWKYYSGVLAIVLVGVIIYAVARLAGRPEAA